MSHLYYGGLRSGRVRGEWEILRVLVLCCEECAKPHENNSEDRCRQTPDLLPNKMQLTQRNKDRIFRRMDVYLRYPSKPTLSEATMIGATLDIFRELADGQPMWIKAVEGFDEAKRELSELAELSPGDSFIFNTELAE